MTSIITRCGQLPRRTAPATSTLRWAACLGPGPRRRASPQSEGEGRSEREARRQEATGMAWRVPVSCPPSTLPIAAAWRPRRTSTCMSTSLPCGRCWPAACPSCAAVQAWRRRRCPGRALQWGMGRPGGTLQCSGCLPAAAKRPCPPLMLCGRRWSRRSPAWHKPVVCCPALPVELIYEVATFAYREQYRAAEKQRFA